MKQQSSTDRNAIFSQPSATVPMTGNLTDRISRIQPDLVIERLPVEEVYIQLGSSPSGLAAASVIVQRQRYGPNILREAKGTSLLVKFLSNFTHVMAILLWVGGAVAFLAHMPSLGIAIWLVNLINGVFGFWQEYQAERATQALQKLLPHYAHVLRGGHEERIAAEELVPGDVLILSEGDHISADGRLVQDALLRTDQSTLTGESHPVPKTSEAVIRTDLAHVELPNLVFAGTTVVAGAGRAIVTATGMETEFGKIAHVTQQVGSEPSPLQQELRHVTRIVTVIAVGIGLLFFGLAFALAGIGLAESFIFALGMIVAFVPEGLLPTVTLALALGVQRMAKRNALVKRLSAVETLGCASVVCTDKTGTLTQNEMTVSQIWLPDRPFSVSGIGYDPQGHILDAERVQLSAATGDLQMLLVAAGLCNDSQLIPPSDETPRWTILGDPTEAALLVVARKAGIDLDREARQTPRLRELPFDSRRKRMSTLHQAGSSQIAYIKGAPNEVLALCTRIQIHGEQLALDTSWRDRARTANDTYARDGLRVLAIAMRTLPLALPEVIPENVECDLTLLGLVAMQDPPRPEVTKAVETCRRAGIRIIMITGDYGLTAESIARRIGIIGTAQPRIITGVDLEAMDDAALQSALKDEVLFARVAPEHKLRVVDALQHLGHIVAVTGDGVNDAPALKKADIGVAMGMAGTDVAREAADIILTDDHFASIVYAIEEGRAVYANIKKFTTYIFTSNAPEAVPFILFAFSGGRIPLALNVMHILSIDLGTDMVPALGLGAEPPEPGLMDRPPRRREEHVITTGLLVRAYGWLGPVQALAAMAGFYAMYWMNGYAGQWLDLPGEGSLYQAATAMALAAVVCTQIGNVFTQRSDQTSIFRMNPFANRLIWIGVAVEIILVVAITYIPFFQAIIGTASFPIAYWLFLIIWLPALVVVDELRKALVRSRRRQVR